MSQPDGCDGTRLRPRGAGDHRPVSGVDDRRRLAGAHAPPERQHGRLLPGGPFHGLRRAAVDALRDPVQRQYDVRLHRQVVPHRFRVDGVGAVHVLHHRRVSAVRTTPGRGGAQGEFYHPRRLHPPSLPFSRADIAGDDRHDLRPRQLCAGSAEGDGGRRRGHHRWPGAGGVRHRRTGGHHGHL